MSPTTRLPHWVGRVPGALGALALTATLGFLSSCTMTHSSRTSPIPPPPVARQVEHLSTWHGETVNDPWFWLREKSNPEVIRHLEAENTHTEASTLHEKAFGEALYQEMLSRIQQTDLTVPLQRGDFVYYSRTEEGRQYPIQCRRRAGTGGQAAAGAAEEVLLDLNTLAVGHSFLSLGGFDVSDDGRQLLYSTDTTGFRQYTLYRKDLSTGETSGALAERVTSFEWSADGRWVLYVTEDAVTKRSNQLWRLRLDGGGPEKVLEEPDELFTVQVGRTKDRRWFVCSLLSTDTWEQRLLPTDGPTGVFRPVLPVGRGTNTTWSTGMACCSCGRTGMPRTSVWSPHRWTLRNAGPSWCRTGRMCWSKAWRSSGTTSWSRSSRRPWCGSASTTAALVGGGRSDSRSPCTRPR